MENRWSTKKKIGTSVFIILVVAVITLGLFYIFKPEPPQKVSLVTVGRGEIVQTLDATGTVESSNQEKFTVLNDTKVLTVNFRVGDRVQKGDVLATFDTTSLGKIIDAKQKNYKMAQDAYVSARDSAKTSASDLVQLEKDVNRIENEIKDLEKKMSSEDKKEAEEVKESAADKFNSLFGNNFLISLIRTFSPVATKKFVERKNMINILKKLASQLNILNPCNFLRILTFCRDFFQEKNF